MAPLDPPSGLKVSLPGEWRYPLPFTWVDTLLCPPFYLFLNDAEFGLSIVPCYSFEYTDMSPSVSIF